MDRLADTVLVRPGLSNLQSDEKTPFPGSKTPEEASLRVNPQQEDQNKRQAPQSRRATYCKLENGLVDLLLPDEDLVEPVAPKARSKRKKKRVPVYLDTVAVVDEQLLEEEAAEATEEFNMEGRPF